MELLPPLLNAAVYDQLNEQGMLHLCNQGALISTTDGRIKVHNTGMLVANVPWDETSSRLQSIRATNSFGVTGKPWFDNVVVNGLGGGEWYAQARLLISCKIGPEGHSEKAMYVFVRYYTTVGTNPRRGDVLHKSGCTRLTWETKHGQPVYGVVRLSSLKRRVYLMPSFREGEEGVFFYLANFKWDRQVADVQGFEGDSDNEEEADGEGV